MKLNRGDSYVLPANFYLRVVRLHVNIFDTDQLQFTIPESVIRRPSSVPATHVQSSDLEFHYNSAPFAFWITRRSEKESAPIFDTRSDSVPFVFEDRYLQASPIFSPRNII